jgi:phosphoinositide-3-kinase, regulatory subunit 4
MERIWADYESIEPYLIPDTGNETVMDVKVDYGSSAGSSKPYQVYITLTIVFCAILRVYKDILPVELHIPNRESRLRGAFYSGQRAATEGLSFSIWSCFCTEIGLSQMGLLSLYFLL